MGNITELSKREKIVSAPVLIVPAPVCTFVSAPAFGAREEAGAETSAHNGAETIVHAPRKKKSGAETVGGSRV